MSKPRATWRPKTTWLVILVLVLVGGTLAGLRTVRVLARRDQVAPYSTAQAVRGTLEVTVTGTGTLVPASRQYCVVSAGGKVAQVLVAPGQPVRAGQTLVVLSNESLADQVAQARLDLRLAQIDLDALTKPGHSLATEADIAAARAAVDNARLAADRARRNVEDLTLEAAFDGRVSGLAVRPGDEVPAGTTLLTLASSSELKAVLSVPEDRVKNLSVGQELTVTVTPLTRDLRGRVSSIGAQGTLDRGQVYYPVTVTLTDSDPAARGGMSVIARIETGSSYPGTVTVYGSLAYVRLQPVVTPTGGTVKAVHVTEDQLVRTGELLLTLENDQARAALTAAEADLARAEERLAQLTAPGPSSYPAGQIEKARLRVEQAALRLASLERQLDDLTVRAEFDGVVTDLPVKAGDLVAPNARVAVVADLSRVEAVISVDELEVAGLAPGQEAQVRLDALPGETLTGTLVSLSLEGVLRDGVTSYEARVSLPGDPRMRAGMSASVSILVARKENVLLVPAEAVYGAGREASVQLLVNGQPQSRAVVAGLSNGTQTEILEGLREGETVITGSLEVNLTPFGSGNRRSGQGGGFE